MDSDSESKKPQLQHSTTHPKYLHSNSTSHKWVFGAIAELIDNSIDAGATQFDINAWPKSNPDRLVFQDNGSGMSLKALHLMVSFGHCSKADGAIGKYGNGFKSGSMRVGSDALILTKDKHTRTCNIGFLSQTFLEDINANEVLVPLISLTEEDVENATVPEKYEEAMNVILKYSQYHDVKSLVTQFDELKDHGTRVIVSSLRRMENAEFELEFKTKNDIRIASEKNLLTDEQNQSEPKDTQKAMEVSLRAYCAILYLEPKIHIYIRGERVRPIVMKYELYMVKTARYTPKKTAADAESDSAKLKKTLIYFGFNTSSKENDGFFIYHRKRLIKGFMRVGMQLQGNSKGNGVVGIINADFLNPTHNKQDFDNNNQYNKLRNSLVKKLSAFWSSCKIEVSEAGMGIRNFWKKAHEEVQKQDIWVQCDRCFKWRKMHPEQQPSSKNLWYCEENPDTSFASCDVPEEEVNYPLIVEAEVKDQVRKARQEKAKKKRGEDDDEDDEMTIKSLVPAKRTTPKKGKRAQKRKANPMSRGQDAVGKRCSVYWTTENAWYPGTISHFDEVTKEYKVTYDDGDVYWEADDEDLKIEGEEPRKSERKRKKRKTDSEADTESDPMSADEEFSSFLIEDDHRDKTPKKARSKAPVEDPNTITVKEEPNEEDGTTSIQSIQLKDEEDDDLGLNLGVSSTSTTIRESTRKPTATKSTGKGGDDLRKENELLKGKLRYIVRCLLGDEVSTSDLKKLDEVEFCEKVEGKFSQV